MQTTETIRSLERVLTSAQSITARPEGFAGRIAREIDHQRRSIRQERGLPLPRFQSAEG